jgi:uncharacterized Zn-binding protein involved in type VI secretion
MRHIESNSKKVRQQKLNGRYYHVIKSNIFLTNFIKFDVNVHWMIMLTRKKGYWLTITLVFLITLTIYSETGFVNAETGETKWALDRVIVGEGGEYVVPEGDRFEGTFDRWVVGESSINYHSREIDHNGADDYTNAVYQFTLPSFPSELESGQQVELTASGSALGYMREEYFVVVLDFWSDNIALSGINSAGEVMTSPNGPSLFLDIDIDNWDGETWVTTVTEAPSSDSMSVQFDVPLGEIGDEFSIIGSGRNGINAGVEWVYQCVEIGQEYGVIERDGNLYIISPPGETLDLKLTDIPIWARYQLVTVGAMAICVGPPDKVISGDTSVLVEGAALVRLGDSTMHGGTIIEGSPKIFVNGVSAAIIGGFHTCPIHQGGAGIPHVGGPVLDSPSLASSGIEELDDYVFKDLPLIFLEEEVSEGSTVIDVSGEGIEIGDAVIIGSDGELSEMARVEDKGSLILDRPLVNSYPAGTLVTKVPDEYSDTVTPHISQYDPTESITSEDSGPIADFFLPGYPIWSIVLGLMLISMYRARSEYPVF